MLELETLNIEEEISDKIIILVFKWEKKGSLILDEIWSYEIFLKSKKEINTSQKKEIQLLTYLATWTIYFDLRDSVSWYSFKTALYLVRRNNRVTLNKRNHIIEYQLPRNFAYHNYVLSYPIPSYATQISTIFLI